MIAHFYFSIEKGIFYPPWVAINRDTAEPEKVMTKNRPAVSRHRFPRLVLHLRQQFRFLLLELCLAKDTLLA